MSQIETIKNMQSKGLGPSAIAERLQIDRKTVRKVMNSDTFENRKPKTTVVQPSKLDPYKPLIQSWLEEDRKNRYKQRHTAQRIHNRLVEECPEYDASYPLVQRYVRSLREALHQEGTLNGHRAKRKWTSGRRTSTMPAARQQSASFTGYGTFSTGLAAYRTPRL